jgi:GDP-4-dehydro-6-deoxy-D-mannose reductase
MRTLVTGAAGFAGRHLVTALAGWEHEVVGTDLAVPEDAPAGATWRTLDVTDRQATETLLGEVRPDCLFHLAGFAHVGKAEQDPEGCLAVNFGGTRNVLDGCLAASAETRAVVVSSAEVYGRVPHEDLPVREELPLRPGTAYALSKAAAEMAARHASARGLSVVTLRPFNHIGPGQSDDFVASAFAHQLARIEAGKQEPILRVGNLEAVRDLTDVRDTVRGYVRAAVAGLDGAVYNVTSGDAVPIKELLRTLLDLCTAEVEVVEDPERMRPVDLPVFHGSGMRLAGDTGFRAELHLRETLADVLDYWREREASPR